MGEGVNEYQEALYDVKRNFLIIGLTGYTGAGCSESRAILSGTPKPCLPNYEAIYKPVEVVSCAGKAHDQARCNQARLNERNSRIYKKLERTWIETEWHRFVPIKISAVIFSFALHRSIVTEINHPVLNLVRGLAKKHKLKANYMSRLWESSLSNKKANTDIICKMYEGVVSAYEEFKQIYPRKPFGHSKVLQIFGDHVRKYGVVLPFGDERVPSAKNLFLIPEAVRKVVKSYYWSMKREKHGPFHFVIDAFRNPIEVEYFKWRYSEFYLVGVLRDERERKSALDLSDKQFSSLNRREKGELFKKKTGKAQKALSSQNVYECLQKADMYIENIPGQGATFSSLKFHLIKLMSLAKNPGCIPPTKDERNMQIAMTAKQMSGCISRQVGATLVNSAGYVIGVGWNDPPSGQTPCSLRTGKELVNGASDTVFSDYERGAKFIEHIRNRYNIDAPFCFRGELSVIENGKKNEFTRALHAEENALFQGQANSGGDCNGATLYTTSRTCTLCAKKAYQLGVSRICYVEEYTDIAIEQTLRAGERAVVVERFQGVTGAAFFRLFASLIPEKDLIQLYVLGG